LTVLSLRLWLGLLPAAGNVGRLARTHPAMHAEQPARKACQHPSPLDITRQLHWTDLNVRSGQLQAKFEVMIKLVCCSLPPSRADVRPLILCEPAALHVPASRPPCIAALSRQGTPAGYSPRARTCGFWGDKIPIPQSPEDHSESPALAGATRPPSIGCVCRQEFLFCQAFGVGQGSFINVAPP